MACHIEDVEEEFAAQKLRLQGSGMKLTQGRLTLLKAMIVCDGPFSAEDLFNEAGKLQPRKKRDLVTVYRTLASFEEEGMIRRCDLGDGVVRYDLTSLDGQHHHHIVCKTCQRVEPLDMCFLPEHEKSLRKMGFTDVTHRLEFFGLCSDCA